MGGVANVPAGPPNDDATLLTSFGTGLNASGATMIYDPLVWPD